MTADDKPHPPRRRQSERYAAHEPLEACCSSWKSFHALFARNVSEAGLFIPTERHAVIGEPIVIKLSAPDGRPITMRGEVKHVLGENADRPGGLGVQIRQVADHDATLYRELVTLARSRCEVSLGEIPIFGLEDEPLDGPMDEDVEELELTMEESGLVEVSEMVELPGPPPLPTAPRPSPTSPPRAAPPPPAPSARNPQPVSSPATTPRLPGGPVPPRVPAASTRTTGPPGAPSTAPPALPPPSPARSFEQHPVVAIDFGTSRSAIAAVINRQATVIQLPDRSWDIASVVGFLPNLSATIGKPARAMLSSEPQHAIASPKRLLGRRFRDREIEPYLGALAIAHSEGQDGGVVLHPRGATLTMAQVCAPVIYHLKTVAEKQLGHAIKEAVFTTPVSFDQRRYGGLVEAARLAGLRVLEFVDEPTAAALTHRFDPSFRGLVAVYDFGGGTFDFSVVDVSGADPQVIATAGDVWLGGDDFDDILASAAADTFWRENNIELRHNAVQWQRLLVAAEQAKRRLSSQAQATLALDNVAITRAGSLGMKMHVTREQFNQLAADIIQRSFDTCLQALELAQIRPQDLGAIYLSGGTSHVPAVREAMAKFFGRPPRALVPPERAVVLGAALYASMLKSGGAR